MNCKCKLLRSNIFYALYMHMHMHMHMYMYMYIKVLMMYFSMYVHVHEPVVVLHVHVQYVQCSPNNFPVLMVIELSSYARRCPGSDLLMKCLTLYCLSSTRLLNSSLKRREPQTLLLLLWSISQEQSRSIHNHFYQLIR